MIRIDYYFHLYSPRNRVYSLEARRSNEVVIWPLSKQYKNKITKPYVASVDVFFFCNLSHGLPVILKHCWRWPVWQLRFWDVCTITWIKTALMNFCIVNWTRTIFVDTSSTLGSIIFVNVHLKSHFSVKWR